MEAALKAARRCNDFATAVRALEGLKQKVEKPAQFELYLKELAPLMEELGSFLFFFFFSCGLNWMGEERDGFGGKEDARTYFETDVSSLSVWL